MHLDIPYICQPEKSVWCGAASAAMVLKWYGVNMSQKQIAKELPIIKRGVSAGRLGQFFLRKGFDVTMQFWLQGLESRKRGLEGDIENPFVINALQRGIRQRHHFRTRNISKEALTFLKCGGNIRLNPPFLRYIEKSIHQKQPVILQIDSAFREYAGRTQQGHYVVVKGINNPWNDDSQVSYPNLIIHDPDIKPDMFYYFDEILYSCHIWYGCVLFVKPK